MKRRATPSDEQRRKNHGLSFTPVFDTRKRKIPGLWQRGERYYAQLRVDLGNGHTAPRRLALNARNLDEAKGELESKRTQRRDGKLPQTGNRPKFEVVAQEYLDGPTFAQKKLSTQQIEKLAVNRWMAHLGGVRVDKITAPMIHAYREKRLVGRKARTINLDTIALRNVLKLARERGLIERLPEVRQLAQKPPPKRELLTKEQFAALIASSGTDTTKNSKLFRDYLRFLALSGSREKEALAIRWADVDFTRETVTIGSGGVSKNHKSRAVDFSPELKALLSAMYASRPPDSSFLFPSPQRGARDVGAHSLRESLRLVRTKANLPAVGFHDLRHFFASQCVMTGLDFMTIAAWLGHSDGGILVGKVYGHLADTHKKAAAQKLRFFGDGTAKNKAKNEKAALPVSL
jgi:integrase